MEVELRTNDNYLLTLFEGRKDVLLSAGRREIKVGICLPKSYFEEILT